MEGVAWVEPVADVPTFEEAVLPHYAALVRRLTAVLGDRESAADVVQEAYFRAFRAWGSFDGTDPRAWVYTIALRLAFNERRRRRRWSGIRSRRVDVPPWVAAEDRSLHAALGRLRPEHRAALLLNVVDGYTQSEVARMLGIAPGTVASWVSRAKGHMREMLTDA